MHFQEIKDDYYSSIPQKIKEFIPEFISVFEDEDGIYPILGDLGNFLIENINDKKLLSRIMLFLNDSVENGGTETYNAIVLQIFDRFYEEMGNITKIYELLSPKNKVKVGKFFQFYNKNR